MSMYRVTMPDGSKWDIPVETIVMHRATYYAKACGGYASAVEETWAMFNDDDYNIEDWARNNMNWYEVDGIAEKVENGECDHQEGWMNGEVEIRRSKK